MSAVAAAATWQEGFEADVAFICVARQRCEAEVAPAGFAGKLE